MKSLRTWVTPLATGAFLVVAGTGVAMFFHQGTALGRELHEWLGWAMIAAGVLHAVVNWNGLKSHLGRAMGKTIIGAFAVALVLALVPLSSQGGQGASMRGVVAAMSRAQVKDLAPIAGRDADALVADLRKAGMADATAESTVASLAGPNQARRLAVMGIIFGTDAGAEGRGGHARGEDRRCGAFRAAPLVQAGGRRAGRDACVLTVAAGGGVSVRGVRGT